MYQSLVDVVELCKGKGSEQCHAGEKPGLHVYGAELNAMS